MQFKAIKNLAAAIAVLVSTSAGFSAFRAVHHEDERLANPALQCAQPTSWKLCIDERGAHGTFGPVSATISHCGTSVDVYGTTECIGAKEKRRAVQLVGMMKILMGVNSQYSHPYVVGLIKEFEICPCPEIKPETCAPVVNPCSRPVTPVCHKTK